MDIIQLISAAGIGGAIGSLLTTIVQSWLSHNSRLETRNFQEKKEAYIGLIKAYKAVGTKPGKQELQEFGYWSVRCELIANLQIIEAINTMKTENYSEQKVAFGQVKKLMKKDLGF